MHPPPPTAAPAPDPAPDPGASDAEPRWVLPTAVLLVVLTAALATGGHGSAVVVGGGLLAVGVFRETLRFFERVDAVAGSDGAPPPGPDDPTDRVSPVTA